MRLCPTLFCVSKNNTVSEGWSEQQTATQASQCGLNAFLYVWTRYLEPFARSTSRLPCRIQLLEYPTHYFPTSTFDFHFFLRFSTHDVFNDRQRPSSGGVTRGDTPKTVLSIHTTHTQEATIIMAGANTDIPASLQTACVCRPS